MRGQNSLGRTTRICQQILMIDFFLFYRSGSISLFFGKLKNSLDSVAKRTLCVVVTNYFPLQSYNISSPSLPPPSFLCSSFLLLFCSCLPLLYLYALERTKFTRAHANSRQILMILFYRYAILIKTLLLYFRFEY